jgi:hypothetical protein
MQIHIACIICKRYGSFLTSMEFGLENFDSEILWIVNVNFLLSTERRQDLNLSHGD